MEIKQLLTEDRAVSPVIGVILMVAITVILAAVIGTFVLGLGQNVQSTPQASFGFDFDVDDAGGGTVTVAHEGGDRLDSDNTNSLTVVSSDDADDTSWDLPVGAGDTTDHTYNDNGTTVRVAWVGPNNESSSTLGSQEAP